MIESKNRLENQLLEKKKKSENLQILKDKKNDLKRRLERVKFEFENVPQAVNNPIGVEWKRTAFEKLKKRQKNDRRTNPKNLKN